MKATRQSGWFRLPMSACVIAMVSLAAAKAPPVVHLPKVVSAPLPVAVWLHGYRSFPGYINDPYFDEMADKLGIAIIGIPGTTKIGDEAGDLQWSEEPTADDAYIQSVLTKLVAQSKINLDLKRVALFGFSQGAVVAAEITAAYPDHYQGAIILSPGGFDAAKLPHMPAGAKTQSYFLSCGAQEAKGNVQITQWLAGRLTAMGAHVESRLFEGMSQHTRPPDFKDKFPEWIGTILKLDSTVVTAATQPATPK